MKKSLSLFLAVCISLSTIAAPLDIASHKVNHAAWDRPLFIDPYVTNYNVNVIGSVGLPNYATNIQVSFNKTVGVPYYAVVQVLGLWGGSNTADYKVFTILFTSTQSYRSVNFPMAYYEVTYPTVSDLLDYGPQ